MKSYLNLRFHSYRLRGKWLSEFPSVTRRHNVCGNDRCSAARDSQSLKVRGIRDGILRLSLRSRTRFAFLLHAANISSRSGPSRASREENLVSKEPDSKHRRCEMFIVHPRNNHPSSVRSGTRSLSCRQIDLVLLHEVVIARVSRFTSVRHSSHHQ